MHIIEIILEGFKSYPTRTSIDPLDPQFKAITGINGSGKSNILYTICFILGISLLQYVRVQNLQELIYKQGNAGVTKAIVTIKFDNRNKKGSPPMMRDYDEILVSRQIFDWKSKFKVNRKVEIGDKIKNMIMSVQLYVNNPHFLIMQGSITQVVNMKPKELLSLKEASGNSRYENNNLFQLKTISKKQSKVDEFINILIYIQNSKTPEVV